VSDYREALRETLKRDEGVVEHAYQDSEGYWTIGCGRLIDKRAGGKLSPMEIDILLANDIQRSEEDAKELFPTFEGLSDARKIVLVSMAFNLGRSRLAGFKRLRQAVSEGDFLRAAAEMESSQWFNQVKGRAVRLCKQMKEG
jgi:lysozyme